MSRLAAATVVGLVLALAGCGPAEPAEPDRLVIAAGDPENVYRLLGDALAEAARQGWSAQVEVLDSDGSDQNLVLVGSGEADVGFANLDSAISAISGELPSMHALPLYALARLYDDYLQLVTLAESGIKQLSDLEGRRVATGAPGSGTAAAANRVLDAAEVQVRALNRLPLDQAAEALADGEIDAFFVAGGVPTPVVQNLAESAAEIRLLPTSYLIDDLRERFGDWDRYQTQTIPAGAYEGVETGVGTVSVPTLLVAHHTLPDDVAYRLTQLLFAVKDELIAAHPEALRLDHRSALATFPIELHPGAVRYYQEVKPYA
jgi:TRAP transporter TAXI family solute receptor